MEKRLPKYLTVTGFKQHVVDWSPETIKRRIKDSGLPAFKDEATGNFMFETEVVLDWFKRRLSKVS